MTNAVLASIHADDNAAYVVLNRYLSVHGVSSVLSSPQDAAAAFRRLTSGKHGTLFSTPDFTLLADAEQIADFVQTVLSKTESTNKTTPLPQPENTSIDSVDAAILLPPDRPPTRRDLARSIQAMAINKQGV
ncbi:hypothetical protein [Arcanobacterium bovis]|uniref:Uncharacterized protein n=1 Tax=Arcanobacterium bovis TaxID=2529275 RepID=A0A4Q9UYL6_9ACTO|nr:hypothetical protein [Arcanobacterium bovis]TBW20715.1 hypothetical protein EZJ44_08470 [Arcanobacterium bovis]